MKELVVNRESLAGLGFNVALNGVALAVELSCAIDWNSFVVDLDPGLDVAGDAEQ